MSETEIQRIRRRRGYWLKLARELSGWKQSGVAKELHLKAGTSILAWEKGRRDPSATQMHTMATLYGVPVGMFADPKPTDEEEAIEARAAYARAAIELAHEDLASAGEPRHDDDAPQDERPDRRSA